jgi:hypothetical protein
VRAPAVALVVLAAIGGGVALAMAGGGAGGRIDAFTAAPPYLPPPPLAPRRTAAGRAAPTARAATSRIAPGAPTDQEIERELEHAYTITGSGGGARSAKSLVNAAALTTQGLATVPPTAPARVAALIHAANLVARAPYVYGGGHRTWVDSAYDCSGSVSFALAAAGLATQPMDSSALAHYGAPGPGRWITIYANAAHAFMTVAGLRFDTSGRQRGGSRWQAAPRTISGFTVRHPRGF